MKTLLAMFYFGSLIQMHPYVSPETADNYPYQHIADYTSQEGETLKDFLLRIAPSIRAFGESTDLEACSAIGVAPDGKHWALSVGTNRSHFACIPDPRRLPAGFKWTGESIHCHGNQKNVILNAADLMFFGITNVGGRMIRIQGQQADHFSDVDHYTPGYLAAPDRLLYQHGAGTDSTVGLYGQVIELADKVK
jgi:hypothetical protein